MKSGAKPNKTRTLEFADQFRFALRAYATEGREAELLEAYELGREAIDEGKSLIEVVSLFQAGLEELSALEMTAEKRARMLRSASNFLIESISPYEMAHRGFQDAVSALRRFNEVLEEEIKRIAHAVHDDAGQALVAVHLALAALSESLSPAQKKQIKAIEQSLAGVEKQLRAYSHELRPTALDDLGLVPAIRFMAGAVSKRACLPVEVTTKISKRLPSSVEIALYRIVQEALTNITKHARASRASIRVFRQNGNLCCMIQDDGKGFDAHKVRSAGAQSGLGLVGMRERVNAIGGTLSVDSAPGCGTKILIQLPTQWEQ
jgi:signal transduction histidine kinase